MAIKIPVFTLISPSFTLSLQKIEILNIMGKYLDPRADLTFKKIFGEHKHLVISLLNAMLPLADDELVESIEYDYSRPDNIIAVIGLDNQLNLPKGTRAEISSDLLGNVKLELKFGPNPIDLMAKGDTIEGGTASGLMGRAAEMIPQIEVMLPKLDSILASLNTLMQDPAIKNSLHNVDDITANLSATSRELNTLSIQLNKQMPSMMAKTNGILTNAEGVTQKLNDIDIVATMQKVDRAMANVEQTTAKLNSNDGTLGLLMRDADLYNNMNATMQSADSLLIDMRQHPKRYVHFSVFGKKDK